MDATHSSSSADPIQLTVRSPDEWGRHTADFCYTSPDGWTATGVVTRTRRRGVVVSEIQIQAAPEPDGEPGAISSLALRQLPTGAIVAAGMAKLPEYPGEQPPPAPERERKPQAGRQPLSDALIREVAVRYMLETAPGRPRGANIRLATHFGKPPATVARWVMRARADGWLGPAVPGREGGQLGPRFNAEKVIPLLKEAEAMGYSHEDIVEALAQRTEHIDGSTPFNRMTRSGQSDAE